MSNIDFNSISLTSRELKTLKKMKRGFHPDIDIGKHLNQIGFAKWVFRGDSGYWKITANGERFLDYVQAHRRDRAWNRGLSIIAIIISLVALGLEFDDRGYLDWAKPEKTHAAQSIPVISESQ